MPLQFIHFLKSARIFILAFTLLFITGFISSCSTLDPVISDICQITDDICFYATEICDLYNADSIKFDNSSAVFAILTDNLYKLKLISQSLDPKSIKKVNLDNAYIKQELILIQQDLKKLLPSK